MPLAVAEIIAGNVAILDGDMLIADPDVQNGDHGFIGKRPFLCIDANEEDCSWMLLTTQVNRKRLLLDKWKIPGSVQWMAQPQYLHDARKIFRGPKTSFIGASIGELPHNPHPRPKISDEGVSSVKAEIQKYQPTSALNSARHWRNR